MPKMKYVGKGKWLRGVPKRDLNSEEVERCGGVIALEKTGLYEAVKKQVKVKKSPGRDNPDFLPAYREDGEVNDG
jgi:hypothetical protein